MTPATVPTETAKPDETPTETVEARTQQLKLIPEDGDSFDEFGEAVAVADAGTTALIGAPADEDPNGQFAGAAYVFEATDDSWAQRAKLHAADGDEFDSFGEAVALSRDGSTALVGAREDEDPNGEFAGSAYVFDGTGERWSEQAKLVPSDGDNSDGFGWAVSLSGDGTAALVSARKDEDPNGSLAGSAYVFEAADQGWTQRAKLIPEDGDSFDTFGEAVTLSMDGQTALIGAPSDEDPNGSLAGSAYVFEDIDGTWTQQAKLTPDDGDRQDLFGWSVALSGDATTALVPAYSDDDPNGSEAGAAYVYEGSGSWTQRAKLAASDGNTSDFFGFSVAVTGDGSRAVIGAPGDENGTADNAGSAYVFERSEEDWVQREKLAAADGDDDTLLGRGLGVSEDGATAFVGAPFDGDPNGEFAGSVYVFTL